jgi:hypothetical protein
LPRFAGVGGPGAGLDVQGKRLLRLGARGHLKTPDCIRVGFNTPDCIRVGFNTPDCIRVRLKTPDSIRVGAQKATGTPAPNRWTLGRSDASGSRRASSEIRRWVTVMLRALAVGTISPYTAPVSQ